MFFVFCFSGCGGAGELVEDELVEEGLLLCDVGDDASLHERVADPHRSQPVVVEQAHMFDHPVHGL